MSCPTASAQRRAWNKQRLIRVVLIVNGTLIRRFRFTPQHVRSETSGDPATKRVRKP
jgi:hypothetical protein